MNRSEIKQTLLKCKAFLLKKEQNPSISIELAQESSSFKELIPLKSNENRILRQEIELNLKIEKFLNWYLENILKKEDRLSLNSLRNFIDKMAIWYELKYPDCEVEKIMDGESEKDINKIIFRENEYINHLEKNSDFLEEISKFEWSKFYNTKIFLQSLSWEEQNYLKKAKYPQTLRLPFYSITGFFTLSAKGKIMNTIVKRKIRKRNPESQEYRTLNQDISSYFQGHSITEFFSICENLKIELTNTEKVEVQKWITNYEKEKYAKEELLNCVMYRILERGGFDFGTKRAYLFAKEFHRKIEIPVQYAMIDAGYHPESLFHLYLKDGGNPKLKCYNQYFFYPNREWISFITIEEYFQKREENYIQKTEIPQRKSNSVDADQHPQLTNKSFLTKVKQKD